MYILTDAASTEWTIVAKLGYLFNIDVQQTFVERRNVDTQPQVNDELKFVIMLSSIGVNYFTEWWLYFLFDKKKFTTHRLNDSPSERVKYFFSNWTLSGYDKYHSLNDNSKLIRRCCLSHPFRLTWKSLHNRGSTSKSERRISGMVFWAFMVSSLIELFSRDIWKTGACQRSAVPRAKQALDWSRAGLWEAEKACDYPTSKEIQRNNTFFSLRDFFLLQSSL